MYNTLRKKNMMRELFIAVDVETTGPIPGKYSMFEIGAVCVDYPEQEFVGRLALTSFDYEPDALLAINETIEHLRVVGNDPRLVMGNFEQWVTALTVRYNAEPIFVAINAPFDWMFVAYYFQTLLGHNPFGYSALDVKAYFAGRVGCPWRDANKKNMEHVFGGILPHTHHAIDDARKVAELFRLMRPTTLEMNAI